MSAEGSPLGPLHQAQCLRYQVVLAARSSRIFSAGPESEAIHHQGQGDLPAARCSLLACLWRREAHYLARLLDKASLHVALGEGEVVPYLGWTSKVREE